MLLNKVALSSFSFSCPNSLLLFQCLFCVAATRACHAYGAIRLEPLRWAIVRAWLPVNVIFVVMLGSSFWALASLNVAMVTVLKNLTNLFTLAGDYALYGRTYGPAVLWSMALMALSALCGGLTDLTFSARGYFWQMVNCAAAAGYSLAMRGTMDRVAPLTASGARMDELSMVFYNNLLSLPLVLLLAAGNGELGRLAAEPDLRDARFLVVAALSAAIGFAISFTSLWFIASATPTIYSLVGSLNKVPIAVVGLVAFHTPWTPANLASIAVGLGAGAVFGLAKSAPPPKAVLVKVAAADLSEEDVQLVGRLEDDKP